MPQLLDNLTFQWNNAGTTFTGIRYQVTDTASAAGSLLMDLRTAAGSRFNVRKDGRVTFGSSGTRFIEEGVSNTVVVNDSVAGFTILSAYTLRDVNSLASVGNVVGVTGAPNGVVVTSTGGFGWSSSIASTGTFDLGFFRDAAGTLAQRNGTNAQTFRVYNTFTDVNTYERGYLRWSSNVFQIGTEKLAGTARALELQTDGTTRLTIAAAGDVSWTAGTLSAAGISIAAAGSITIGTGGGARVNILSNAAGNLTIKTAGSDDFGRLQFGGTTSSFPALKRSSATLQVRLADDSGDAALTASTLTASSSPANTSTIAATGYSLTGSSSVGMVDLAGTWNTSGTPTAIKLNITDTASNAASLLLDLGTGGGSFASKFKVDKAGTVTVADAANVVVGTSTGTKIATATSQKIGFWNAAPIAQPTTAVAAATTAATGAGDVVAASTTFDGYTIPQVVKALRNAGLLA